MFKLIYSLIFISITLTPLASLAQTPKRLIVLTDVENEPDDTQSLVRLMLYSNQIDIEGIIATTSTWKKDSISPATIRRVIKAYGKVQPNLLKHASGFPSAASLLALVKNGLPAYGMQGVGDGKDSEGSEWLIKTLEADDPRPLWVTAWGGTTVLAQALYKIKHTKSAAVAKQLIAKLRVYTISDQDDSGSWIRKNFPDLFYIVSPGDYYDSATWIAINTPVKGIDNTSISTQWIAENIQQGHGPLGVEYPDTAWGMEGDTPAFLGLIPNGLNAIEHPDWGGWAGRYEHYIPDFSKIKKGRSDVPLKPETRAIWTDAVDIYTPFIPNEYGRTVKKSAQSFTGNQVSLWRWREEIQRDFAARMDWCTQSYAQANHPPIPKLLGTNRRTVHSGERVNFEANGSSDPDGDHISYLWFHYPEAGSYDQPVTINDAENDHKVYLTAPVVDKKETIHVILKVTDKGTPALSRYQRIILTVLPPA